MYKMKKAVRNINRIMDQAEERICKVEYMIFETIQSENEKDGRMPM